MSFLSHSAGQNGGLHHCCSAQEVCRGHAKLFLQVAQHQHIKLSEHGLVIGWSPFFSEEKSSSGSASPRKWPWRYSTGGGRHPQVNHCKSTNCATSGCLRCMDAIPVTFVENARSPCQGSRARRHRCHQCPDRTLTVLVTAWAPAEGLFAQARTYSPEGGLRCSRRTNHDSSC